MIVELGLYSIGVGLVSFIIPETRKTDYYAANLLIAILYMGIA